MRSITNILFTYLFQYSNLKLLIAEPRLFSSIRFYIVIDVKESLTHDCICHELTIKYVYV